MKVELTKILLKGNEGSFMVSLVASSNNLSILNNHAGCYFLKQDLVHSI